MEWRTPENMAMQTRRILGRRKKGKAEEREVEKKFISPNDLIINDKFK